MYSLVTLLLVIPALVHSQDYDEYEVDPNAIEGLPASAADLLDAPYDDGFNCDQQDAGYGYYADVNNNCQVGSNLSDLNEKILIHGTCCEWILEEMLIISGPSFYYRYSMVNVTVFWVNG